LTTLPGALYSAAPPLVQSGLLSLYGLWLRHLRYGGRHASYLATLLESERWPAVALDEYRRSRLERVVRHAYESVPLYASRGGAPSIRDVADLASVPLLTKDQLQASADHITSRHHHGRLQEVHTGGTTGKPLTIYCTRDVLRHNYAFFGRLLRWARIEPGDRRATFAGRTIVPTSRTRPPFWRYNAAARTLLFSSYHLSPDSMPAYAKALEEFAPALIDSYPSSLEPIAKFLVENPRIRVRPKAIVTSSETLHPPVRALIESAFSTRVFDHYGGAEMAALITQCERGTYHVNPEFGIVELLRDGREVMAGEEGEIVATGFINPIMPLIRYSTGDSAVKGDGRCECGRAFPTIQRIEGRLDDVVVTPEGRRVGRLDPIFKSVTSLYETRIVQDAPDHIRVETVLRGPLAPSDRDELLRGLRDRLGSSMRVDFVEVESLPRTRGGKLRSVVNLVERASRTTTGGLT
jgi:phenylacetate-CoA ligase